jgi:hypothetical protein
MEAKPSQYNNNKTTTTKQQIEALYSANPDPSDTTNMHPPPRPASLLDAERKMLQRLALVWPAKGMAVARLRNALRGFAAKQAEEKSKAGAGVKRKVGGGGEEGAGGGGAKKKARVSKAEGAGGGGEGKQAPKKQQQQKKSGAGNNAMPPPPPRGPKAKQGGSGSASGNNKPAGPWKGRIVVRDYRYDARDFEVNAGRGGGAAE